MVTTGNRSSKNSVSAAVGGEPDESAPEDMVRADKLDIPESVRKRVTHWQDEIRADKKYFDKVFKRMREDMEYTRLGAKKEWVDADKYTVPIINRFINQAVAALYAKNPKAVAKRKKRLMYALWDGTQETAKACLFTMQSGQDAGGQCAAVLQEIQAGKATNAMLDKAGKTLEIIFEHYTGIDYPDFKKRMKANVRRAKTTGVGYTEIGFHRATEPDPDVTKRIGDMTAQIEFIKATQSDVRDGELSEDDERVSEMESTIKTLEEESLVVVEEGIVFDFPRSTDIIPHRRCTNLVGFIGADYVTREYHMDKDEIKETFKVDIGSNYKTYVQGKASSIDSAGGDEAEGDRGDTSSDDLKSRTSKQITKGKACVWRVFNKKTRQVLWMCEGYPGWLREPAAIDFQVPGFWPIFPLTFNDVEDEKEIFPYSDAHYLKHPQREFNNAREGLREHRRANRPKWFTKSGVLEEDEKTKLESAPAFAVVELKGIEGDMKIDQLIQGWRGIAIDPNLYETGSIIKDVLYGVGAQTADMGQTGDATATESSIAEQSRMSTLSSNVDDLDEHLSELARATAYVGLQLLNKETVIEIVGPGAVWPELDPDTISKEIYLEIKAGSSGRPNQAAELAALERGMQYLVQLGGVSGPVIARKYATLLDIDEEEMIVEGLPSIQALNAMAIAKAEAQNKAILATHSAQTGALEPKAQSSAGAAPQASAMPASAQPGTGNPATDPNQQGLNGKNNDVKPPGASPQGQPAYPPTIHRYNAQGARI